MAIAPPSGPTHTLRSIPLGAVVLLATACGGGGGGGGGTATPPPPPPPPATYTVGGMVTGLTGTGLVLQNSGGNNLAVTANGPFTFATSLSAGAAYSVAVATRPSAPSQACVVFNGSGTIASANVTGVDVVCGRAPGKFLYATFDSPVVLRGYAIDPLTGALSPIQGSTRPSGSNPSGFVASPNGEFLYTFNVSTTDVSIYRIDAATGALTEIAGSPFALGFNPAQPLFRPDGAFLYLTRHDGLVSTFGVDATTGTLMPVGTPQAIGSSLQLAIEPSGRFLYAVSGVSPQVYGFATDAATGDLTAVPNSPYTLANGYPAFGDAGSVLYLSKPLDAFPDNSAVLAYAIDATTGALTPVAGSPFAPGVAGGKLELSPNGQFLFVANNTNGGGTITSFAVDSTTGALTPTPSPSIQIGAGTVSYDVDPFGRYIAGFTFFGSAATLLSIEPTTGALSATTLPPFGYVPLAGLLDPSGLFGYLLQYGPGNIHPYQIDPIALDAYDLPVMNNGVALRSAVIVGSQ